MLQLQDYTYDGFFLFTNIHNKNKWLHPEIHDHVQKEEKRNTEQCPTGYSGISKVDVCWTLMRHD